MSEQLVNIRKIEQERIFLANSLMGDAERRIKGNSSDALGYQWALASAQFKEITGMTLTDFYVSLKY